MSPDHSWLKPQVPDAETAERWREVCADTRREQNSGAWLTETVSRDDWPGDPAVYDHLAGVERRMRRLSKRQPSWSESAPAEDRASRIPDRYRNPDTAPAWLTATPAWSTAMDWVAAWLGPERPRKGMLILGPVGTGKTGIATAVASMAGEPWTAGYWPVRELLTQAKNDMTSDGRTLELVAEKPLLVLDDLGVERRTAYNADLIAGLVESRHAHGRPLVVTSNLSHDELRAHLGEAGHDRAYSRLIELCDDVALVGEDRRWAA